jgi:hypothetical protein
MSNTNYSNDSTDYSGNSGRSSISIQPNDKLIENISSIIESLIEENKNLLDYQEKLNIQKQLIFNKDELPTISIKNYLFRIQLFSEAEDNTLIISLIFLDKICDTASIILTEYNVHRLLFISVLIAIKYNEDLVFELDCYSKIAGMTKKEINKLEHKFLELIKFEVFVHKQIFEKYKSYINNISLMKDKICEEDNC